MRIKLSIAAAALALAACSAARGPVILDRDPQAVARACAADQYQALVGQPAGEVDMGTLPRPVRMTNFDADLSPNDALPGRMTIVTGQDGRVSNVICG